MRRIAVVPLLSLLATACAEPAPEPRSQPALHAVRVQTFGDAEGPGVLSNVFDVDVSSDGRVYASEPTLQHVMVFAPDGTFERVLGRAGQGPGEFQAPGNLTWTGDTLVVYDFQLGANLFDPGLSFAGRVSFHVQTDDNPWFGILPFFLLADGSVMGFAPTPTSAVASGEIPTQRWFRLSRTGDILDTLAVLPLKGQFSEVDFGTPTPAVPDPLPSNPLSAIPPDGSFIVLVERAPATVDGSPIYRVDRVALTGDTVRYGDQDFTPASLSEAERDSIAESKASWYADVHHITLERATQALRDQIAWPAYRPPVTAALAATDGTVWLRREKAQADSIRWDVLDAELEPLGTVKLPAALDAKVVMPGSATTEGAGTGWRLYGVVLDEYDVPSIEEWRVTPGR